MTVTPITMTLTTTTAGIPFTRHVRTELRKLTDTRAGRWLLIMIVAITLLIVVVTLFVAGPTDLTYEKFVDYTQTPQKLLLPVLGILAITSEWSQRTGLVTFTLEPRRGRVLLAKVVATLILGVVIIALTFVCAAVGNLLGMALRGGDGSWASVATSFRDIALVQLTWLLQGVAFGMVLLISAAAIIVFYTLPNVWSGVFQAVPALKHLAPWVDLNKAQTPLYLHDTTGSDWLRLSVATTLWVAVPLIIGTSRIRRTEVTST